MNIPCNENDRLTPPADTRPRVDEALYQGLHPYVESAKALARLTYKSLYIIDYNKLNFLYISSNPLFLCGESVDEVMREGYQFYYRHVPEEDLAFLQQVNQAGFNFYKEIAISERTEYTISYNFRIIPAESKEPLLINHQLTPLKLDSSGNIWLSLCLVSLAHTREVGEVYVSAVKSNKADHPPLRRLCQGVPQGSLSEAWCGQYRRSYSRSNQSQVNLRPLQKSAVSI